MLILCAMQPSARFGGADSAPRRQMLEAAVLQIALVACTGWLVKAGVPDFAGCCLGAAVSLGAMIWMVDLRQPGQCW